MELQDQIGSTERNASKPAGSFDLLRNDTNKISQLVCTVRKLFFMLPKIADQDLPVKSMHYLFLVSFVFDCFSTNIFMISICKFTVHRYTFYA